MSTSRITMEFFMYMSTLLTAPGLLALVSFSTYAPDAKMLLPVVIAPVALSILLPVFFHDPSSKVPPLLCLANVTFGLVVTMAVLLNIVAQLCPPQGRELALIPVYVLICVSRIGPSMVAYAVQGLLSVILASLFLVSSVSRHARPAGGDGIEAGETFDFLDVAEVLVCSLYACSPQFTGVFDWVRISRGPEWVWIESKNGWYLRTGKGVLVLSSVARGVFYILFFLSSNSALYNFYYENASPVPQYYTVSYGILLAFASMQMAACWFNALQKCIEEVSSSAYAAVKIVRVQHILYALLVASAWIFPLQLAGLRGVIVTILLVLNAIF